LDGGLLVNAVRPDAVRVAPPLLVTDAEIDAALAILAVALSDALTGAQSETGG
jgi:acetylornithine aminotransferase